MHHTQGSVLITLPRLPKLRRHQEISLPEQAVLIENGIIKKIRSTASIRTGNGITVIEGSAKYLLPGLLVCIHISLMSRANIRTPAKQN